MQLLVDKWAALKAEDHDVGDVNTKNDLSAVEYAPRRAGDSLEAMRLPQCRTRTIENCLFSSVFRGSG